MALIGEAREQGHLRERVWLDVQQILHAFGLSLPPPFAGRPPGPGLNAREKWLDEGRSAASRATNGPPAMSLTDRGAGQPSIARAFTIVMKSASVLAPSLRIALPR